MRSARTVAVVVIWSALAGCGGDKAGEGAAPSAAPTPAPTYEELVASPPSATPSATEPTGPTVTIPAGKLVAGAACGDHPRMPSEEPAGVSVAMTAFSIDAYPYPNDPSLPALTGVTQADATKYCAARGRRLCTELEWERACKGPKNTRYEYGSAFDAKRCSTKLGTQANEGAVGALAGCKSEFDVHAMHGFAFEWTKSAWDRNEKGNDVALRGGFGNQPFAHMRCGAAKPSPPDARVATVGFRCCGGPENAAKVEVPVDEHEKLEPLEPLPPALAARLTSALRNGGVKSDDHAQVTVDRAWRWHPVKNAELFFVKVALKEKGAEKPRYVPAILELCDRIAQLSNKTSGAFDEIGDPVSKSEPVGQSSDERDARALLTFAVKSGGDAGEVRLEYQFGQVAITEPPWGRSESTAPSASASAAPTPAPAAAPR